MKFGNYLQYTACLRPEYRSKFIPFKQLRKQLRSAVKAGQKEKNDYVLALQKAVHTSDKFFRKKEAEFLAVFPELAKRARELIGRYQSGGSDVRRAAELVRNDVQNFYHDMEFLLTFGSLNRIAAEKLVHKFDRISGDLPLQIDDISSFCNPTSIKLTMEDTEKLFSLVFEDGVQNKAQQILHSPAQHGVKQLDEDTFKFAFFLGLLVPLLIAVLTISASPPQYPPDRTPPTYFFNVWPIFRGTALFIFYIWLWGIDLFVWARNRINHLYLLDLKPQVYLTWVHAAKFACIVTCVWLACFLLFIGQYKGRLVLIDGVDEIFYVFALVVALLFILLVPLHVFHWSSRRTLLATLFSLILPWGHIGYRQFFSADQLTSLANPLADLQYTACFFFVGEWKNPHNVAFCKSLNKSFGPFVSFLPYFIRFTQCLRMYFRTKEHNERMLREYEDAVAARTRTGSIVMSVSGDDLYKQDLSIEIQTITSPRREITFVFPSPDTPAHATELPHAAELIGTPDRARLIINSDTQELDYDQQSRQFKRPNPITPVLMRKALLRRFPSLAIARSFEGNKYMPQDTQDLDSSQLMMDTPSQEPMSDHTLFTPAHKKLATPRQPEEEKVEGTRRELDQLLARNDSNTHMSRHQSEASELAIGAPKQPKLKNPRLHLINAGKYMASMSVILLSGLHSSLVSNTYEWDNSRIAWVCAVVVSSIYSASWDTVMDWGFMRTNPNHKFLRAELLYPWKWVYYVVIVVNFFLRLAWSMTLSRNEAFLQPDFMLFLVSALEIIRRIQWNVFRMENEMLSNEEDYRSVEEVPAAFEPSPEEKTRK